MCSVHRSDVNFIAAYVYFLFFQIFVFLILVNIFLAILNDAYIAIKEKYDAEEVEEGPPPLTIKQRITNAHAWFRQRKLDNRIEALRKAQRQKELAEKRAARRVAETRDKTLKAMGIDPVAARAKEEAKNGGKGDSGAPGGGGIELAEA